MKIKCSICGRTSDTCKIKSVRELFLCPKHLTQYYRHHKFFTETIYSPNEYVIYNDYAEIILKDKNCKEVGRAIIDVEDVDRCKQYKWHIRRAHKKLYVIASLKQPNSQKLHLHRFIMNYNGTLDIDHLNGNGLDNRKSNLRIVLHSINMLNRQKQCGIRQLKNGKYQVTVMKDYKSIYLGIFNNYEDAKVFRNNFINKYFE